jgi:hypothetical protein
VLEDTPEVNLAQSTLFPEYPPLSYLLGRIDQGNATQRLDNYDLSPQAFLLALRIYSAAISPSYRVRAALPEIYEYDIPFGNSPDGIFMKLKSILLEKWATVVALVHHSEVGSPAIPNFVNLSQVDPPEGVPSAVVQGPLEVNRAVEAEVRRVGQEKIQTT